MNNLDAISQKVASEAWKSVVEERRQQRANTIRSIADTLAACHGLSKYEKAGILEDLKLEVLGR